MGDYGLVDSWKRVFVVSQPALLIPPLLMKNDDQVLIVMNDGRLMLFDAVKNEMQDLETQGFMVQEPSLVGIILTSQVKRSYLPGPPCTNRSSNCISCLKRSVHRVSVFHFLDSQTLGH
ncbi:hypothetical protein R6Q57_027765 [Mikania cordata]